MERRIHGKTTDSPNRDLNYSVLIQDALGVRSLPMAQWFTAFGVQSQMTNSAESRYETFDTAGTSSRKDHGRAVLFPSILQVHRDAWPHGCA
jgi:hypothetical protein